MHLKKSGLGTCSFHILGAVLSILLSCTLSTAEAMLHLSVIRKCKLLRGVALFYWWYRGTMLSRFTIMYLNCTQLQKNLCEVFLLWTVNPARLCGWESTLPTMSASYKWLILSTALPCSTGKWLIGRRMVPRSLSGSRSKLRLSVCLPELPSLEYLIPYII